MTATIGIRREDKSLWERRTPIVPEDVRRLAAAGYRVLVEPSPIRAWPDREYAAAGAEVTADLDAADAIFCVKEVPIPRLLDQKTWIFFAHVVKGQAQNMPLLRALLERNVTLIDYEKIVGPDGRRLVLFGHQAGQAGMIDTLSFLGQRLEAEGTPNPFSGLAPAHRYADVEEAKAALGRVGQRISRDGLQVDGGPVVVAFAGRGNTSRGAQEIFDLLPHEEVDPEDLEWVHRERGDVRHLLFKTVLRRRHLVEPREEGREYDRQEYIDSPGRYRGRLARHLPWLTVLVNCVYWTDRYPRFLSRKDVREVWARGDRRLRIIGDVTIDVDGAIELSNRATQPDDPTYVYDPDTDGWREGLEGPGITILAVDNLPCELPRDASRQFSTALRPFIEPIVGLDRSKPLAELDLPEALRNAIVTHQGELTPNYRYLERYLAADDGDEASSRARR